MNLVKITLDQFSEYRRSQGWSTRDAARELGISQGHLANVLNQKRPPSEEVLQKMFSLLIRNHLAITFRPAIKDLQG
jgi:transcriptional regulator with XRE-family HTH domain